MFLTRKMTDITDEEFEKIIQPHVELMDSYLEDKIIPITIAHYITTGFDTSSLFENTFDIHVNSALNMFNHALNDKDKLKNRIKDILLKEYNMKVTNETPLSIEKINRWLLICFYISLFILSYTSSTNNIPSSISIKTFKLDSLSISKL